MNTYLKVGLRNDFLGERYDSSIVSMSWNFEKPLTSKIVYTTKYEVTSDYIAVS